MERAGLEIFKDVIVSILILICIISLLAVFFYDKISLSKVIPESEEYVLSKQMQKELEDTSLDETQEVIVNYYIDASDLKKYEKTNEYDKGKSNPFAAVSVSDKEENNTNNMASGTNDINNNSSENFYQDDGTK